MVFTDFPATIGAWFFYLIIYVPVLLIVWGVLLYIVKKLFNFNSRKKSLLLLLLIVFSPTLWMIPRIMILSGYYCFKKPEIEFQNSRNTKDNLKILKNGAKIIPITQYPNAIFFKYNDIYYVYAPDITGFHNGKYLLYSLYFGSAKYSFSNLFMRQLANYYEYELSNEEIYGLLSNKVDFVNLLKDEKYIYDKYAFSLGGHYYIPASSPSDMFSNYFLEPKTLFEAMHAVSCTNDPDVKQLPIFLLKLK